MCSPSSAQENNLRIDEDDVMKHLKSNKKQTEYIDKRGMHVVVGKYVGESLSSTPKLTFAEINANNFWVIKKIVQGSDSSILD